MISLSHSYEGTKGWAHWKTFVALTQSMHWNCAYMLQCMRPFHQDSKRNPRPSHIVEFMFFVRFSWPILWQQSTPKLVLPSAHGYLNIQPWSTNKRWTTSNNRDKHCGTTREKKCTCLRVTVLLPISNKGMHCSISTCIVYWPSYGNMKKGKNFALDNLIMMC